MSNQYFKCKDCGYEEPRLAPDYVKVSESPCPKS